MATALAIPVSGSAQKRERTRVHTIYGRSSYYAERFHGRRTASGEVYERDDLTAAHLSLPFGSLVRVTNLRNGRSTVVKITDRGPYDHRFDIDVSGRTAELLGFYRDMVARVRMEILRIGRDSLTSEGKALLKEKSGVSLWQRRPGEPPTEPPKAPSFRAGAANQ